MIEKDERQKGFYVNSGRLVGNNQFLRVPAFFGKPHHRIIASVESVFEHIRMAIVPFSLHVRIGQNRFVGERIIRFRRIPELIFNIVYEPGSVLTFMPLSFK